MFERDYLVKMLTDLAKAIVRSLNSAKKEKDYNAAAESLDLAISEATDLDGSVLMTLSPESIASVLQVANTDPRVVVYVANSMYLQAQYLKKCKNPQMAELREQQAYALANAYKFEISDCIDNLDSEDFNEEELLSSIKSETNE